MASRQEMRLKECKQHEERNRWRPSERKQYDLRRNRSTGGLTSLVMDLHYYLSRVLLFSPVSIVPPALLNQTSQEMAASPKKTLLLLLLLLLFLS